MRGLRQSLAAAATKCGGDLEPHRDCLYVATSRYLVSRVELKCRIHDVHCAGGGQRSRYLRSHRGTRPGGRPARPAASPCCSSRVTCHVSRVTCNMICCDQCGAGLRRGCTERGQEDTGDCGVAEAVGTRGPGLLTASCCTPASSLHAGHWTLACVTTTTVWGSAVYLPSFMKWRAQLAGVPTQGDSVPGL